MLNNYRRQSYNSFLNIFRRFYPNYDVRFTAQLFGKRALQLPSILKESHPISQLLQLAERTALHYCFKRAVPRCSVTSREQHYAAQLLKSSLLTAQREQFQLACCQRVQFQSDNCLERTVLAGQLLSENSSSQNSCLERTVLACQLFRENSLA